MVPVYVRTAHGSSPFRCMVDPRGDEDEPYNVRHVTVPTRHSAAIGTSGAQNWK
jgi:hypothetical protein